MITLFTFFFFSYDAICGLTLKLRKFTWTNVAIRTCFRILSVYMHVAQCLLLPNNQLIICIGYITKWRSLHDLIIRGSEAPGYVNYARTDTEWLVSLATWPWQQHRDYNVATKGLSTKPLLIGVLWLLESWLSSYLCYSCTLGLLQHFGTKGIAVSHHLW